MAALTTCQICGRAIKSSRGTIAHHGYKRPHQQGWQSASCFGAGYRPYEVACDALPPAIAMCERYIASTAAILDAFLDNPPATLTHEEGTWNKVKIVSERPKGFTAATARPDYIRRSYVSMFLARKHDLESALRYAAADLAALGKRLKEWKPA